MSAQSSTVFVFGSESPPLSTDPRKSVSISLASFRNIWSGCVICPIFSSSVIRPSRALASASKDESLADVVIGGACIEATAPAAATITAASARGLVIMNSSPEKRDEDSR